VEVIYITYQQFIRYMESPCMALCKLVVILDPYSWK